MSDTGCITEWGDTANWALSQGCLNDTSANRPCGQDPGPNPLPPQPTPPAPIALFNVIPSSRPVNSGNFFLEVSGAPGMVLNTNGTLHLGSQTYTGLIQGDDTVWAINVNVPADAGATDGEGDVEVWVEQGALVTEHGNFTWAAPV